LITPTSYDQFEAILATRKAEVDAINAQRYIDLLSASSQIDVDAINAAADAAIAVKFNEAEVAAEVVAPSSTVGSYDIELGGDYVPVYPIGTGPTVSLASTVSRPIGVVQSPELVLNTIDADSNGDTQIGASIQEVSVIFSREVNLNQRTAIFNVQYPHPHQPIPAGVYAEAATPFEVPASLPSEIFEFRFMGAPIGFFPIVYIWIPSNPAPLTATVIQTGPGVFQITSGVPTEAKLFLA
jgi:hypothetical protein